MAQVPRWFKYLNIPYKYRGRDLNGLDCYGLVMLYAREIIGIELDDWWYEEEWSKKGYNHIGENRDSYAMRVQSPEINDIVCFCLDLGRSRIVNHVGILVDKPDKVLQAIVHQGVKVGRLSNAALKGTVEGYYRLIRRK
jgi:murein DD-endopeptidase